MSCGKKKKEFFKLDVILLQDCTQNYRDNWSSLSGKSNLS